MNNVHISNSSSIPIYQQLYEQISIQIYNKILEKDTMLPSIRKTAKELRVSVITIKKTWELLELNGLIYTIPGKGSYISSNTEKALVKKRQKYIKEILSTNISQLQQMDVSVEEVKVIIDEMYKE